MTTIQLTPDNAEERQRFLRRLHTIRETDLFKQLRRYRKKINREEEVQRRQVEVGLYKSETGYFSEAVDTIPLLHAYLDVHDVVGDVTKEA